MEPARRLLVLACSDRKDPAGGLLPAWLRYDGVCFRVCKAAAREERFPADTDVLILSAAFGLITPERLIPDYNFRMSPRTAEGWAPEVRTRLAQHLYRIHTREVFLCMGRDYLLATSPTRAWVDLGVTVYWPEGGIGEKQAKLKAWLQQSPGGGNPLADRQLTLFGGCLDV